MIPTIVFATTLAALLLLLTTDSRAATSKHRNPRITTAQKLNRGLHGTPMHSLGYLLERIGHRYHISPYFIAAAAGTESSYGAAACQNNRFNVWGLASCNGSWYVPQFTGWPQAVRFYAAFLTARWPYARTAYDYHGYARCTPCWGRKTAWHMRTRFGVGPGVRYP